MFEYRAWNKMKNVMVYKREDGETEWWDGVNCTDVEMVNGRFNSIYSSYIYLMNTGKLDSKGNKIYQGDITKCGGLYEQICFGEYTDGELQTIGFYTKNKYGESMFMSDTSEYVEVVGNIYENPELLLK